MCGARKGYVISGTKHRSVRRIQQDGSTNDHQDTHVVPRTQRVERKADTGRSSGHRHIGKGFSSDLEITIVAYQIVMNKFRPQNPHLDVDSPQLFLIGLNLGKRLADNVLRCQVCTLTLGGAAEVTDRPTDGLSKLTMDSRQPRLDVRRLPMEAHQLHLAIDPLGYGERAFLDGRQGKSNFLTQPGEQIEVDHCPVRIVL